MSDHQWKRQFKIRWEDTDHQFDWIDADQARLLDAKIGDTVYVVYFDGYLYPGKVVAQRMIRDYKSGN
jgi:hypothetical protein